MNNINQLVAEVAAETVVVIGDATEVCTELTTRFATIETELNDVLALNRISAMLNPDMKGLSSAMMSITIANIATLVPFVEKLEVRIGQLTNFQLPIGATAKHRADMLSALGLLHRAGIAMRTKMEEVMAVCKANQQPE